MQFGRKTKQRLFLCSRMSTGCRGFSLIEMVITLVIISAGGLATMALKERTSRANIQVEGRMLRSMARHYFTRMLGKRDGPNGICSSVFGGYQFEEDTIANVTAMNPIRLARSDFEKLYGAGTIIDIESGDARKEAEVKTIAPRPGADPEEVRFYFGNYFIERALLYGSRKNKGKGLYRINTEGAETMKIFRGVLDVKLRRSNLEKSEPTDDIVQLKPIPVVFNVADDGTTGRLLSCSSLAYSKASLTDELCKMIDPNFTFDYMETFECVVPRFSHNDLIITAPYPEDGYKDPRYKVLEGAERLRDPNHENDGNQYETAIAQIQALGTGSTLSMRQMNETDVSKWTTIQETFCILQNNGYEVSKSFCYKNLLPEEEAAAEEAATGGE